MTFAYPLVQILLYLSLLFSPPDATRITITGPDLALEINRTPVGWAMDHDGKSLQLLISSDKSSDKLRVLGNGVRELTELQEYVILAKDHDWIHEPKLTLHQATTLEKNADGFILRVNDGTPEVRTYTIVFHRRAEPAPDAPAVRVNVIGSVNAPAAYTFPPESTLLDALVAAGGVSRFADHSRIRIVRGPAGEKATTFTYNLEALIKEPSKAPVLQDGDTIMVPEPNF